MVPCQNFLLFSVMISCTLMSMRAQGMEQAQTQLKEMESAMTDLRDQLNKKQGPQSNGLSSQQLEQLESANSKLRTKVQELTKLLDDSRNEKVELVRSVFLHHSLVSPASSHLRSLTACVTLAPNHTGKTKRMCKDLLPPHLCPRMILR
jgi:predicted nuclease with TOPRIM domain